MAVALVQAASGRATGGAATATLAAAPTAGNFLVAFFGDNVNTTTTMPGTPTGWSVLIPAATSGSATAIVAWYRVAQSGDSATLSVTPGGGSSYDLHLAEFSGVSTPTVDQPNTANTGATAATTQTVSTAAAVAQSGELVLSATYGNATFTTPGHGTGWSSLQDTLRLSSAWRAASGATVQSDMFTAANSVRLISGISGVAVSNVHTAAGTAPVAVTATGVARPVRARVGTAPVATSASGVGASTRTRAATATVAVTASGTAGSARVAARTAGAMVTATGAGSSTRSATGAAPVHVTASVAAETPVRVGTGTAACSTSAAGSARSVRTHTLPAMTVHATATGLSRPVRVDTGSALAHVTAAALAASARTAALTALVHVTASGVGHHEALRRDLTLTYRTGTDRWASSTGSDRWASVTGGDRWAATVRSEP